MTSEEPRPYCEDCKWHERIWNYHWCHVQEGLSVITRKEGSKSCERMRSSFGSCGPEGRLFSPSLWTRIISMLFKKGDS